MFLWIALIALAVVTVLILVLPMLRRRGHGAGRKDFDLAVYRDQLAEVERDLARGTLGEAEAAAARLEIERRILRLGKGEGGVPEKGRPTSRATGPVLAVALAIFVPAMAFLLYGLLGSPGLPSKPFSAQPDAMASAPGDQTRDMREMVAQLAERMQDRPDDLRGWRLLARSYAALENYEPAAAAFRHAIRLAPEDAALRTAYGEALVAAAGGAVTTDAQAEFRAAREIEPGNMAARYYLGLADAQAGNFDGALQAWLALFKEGGPGAPWKPMVAARIRAAANELGLRFADIAPEAAALLEERSREREAAESIADLPPEERAEAVQGMVAGLAHRMEDSPTPEGLLRLGRAYEVLQRPDDAREVYGRAAELFPEDRDILWRAGEAERRNGNVEAARDHWSDLLALLEEGSAEHERVRAALDKLVE